MFKLPTYLRFIRVIFSPAATPIGEEAARWDILAQELPRGPFIHLLANEVATDLICDNPEHQSLDEIICQVDDGTTLGNLQQQAETFLHSQYTRCDPTQVRRIVVFRHLIQRRLKFAK